MRVLLFVSRVYRLFTFFNSASVDIVSISLFATSTTVTGVQYRSFNTTLLVDVRLQTVERSKWELWFLKEKVDISFRASMGNKIEKEVLMRSLHVDKGPLVSSQNMMCGPIQEQ